MTDHEETKVVEGEANNGERVYANFGVYKGEVGLVQTSRGLQASWRGSRLPIKGATANVGGFPCTVVDVAVSFVVAGFIVVTLERL